jgi:hypothetical protein
MQTAAVGKLGLCPTAVDIRGGKHQWCPITIVTINIGMNSTWRRESNRIATFLY